MTFLVEPNRFISDDAPCTILEQCGDRYNYCPGADD